jgi:hypothetical protein
MPIVGRGTRSRAALYGSRKKDSTETFILDRIKVTKLGGIKTKEAGKRR